MPLNDRTAFSGARVLNPEAAKPKKTILICGTAHGGTSFVASTFVRLGVPFARPGKPKEISLRTHEHRPLREAFKGGDEKVVSEIALDFARQFDVWGWKLPALHDDFELVCRAVPNPHMVFVFKEPVSVALRVMDITSRDFLRALKVVLRNYQRLVEFAHVTELPILFVSYETAVANLGNFLSDAADFAGVTHFESEMVIEAIRSDGRRYYPSGAIGQELAGT